MLYEVITALIATKEILTPYELAAGLPDVTPVALVTLHRSVAFVLVGVCLAVLALSIIFV